MSRHTPPANPPFTLPAVPSFSTFGDTARPLTRIANDFTELSAKHPLFADLAALASQIAASEFAAAGLCGLTSMHDIVLGQSTRIFDNPHLRIRYDFENRMFRFEYVDGSREPWIRSVAPAEAFPVLDRFLTRRARWFRRGSVA